MNPKLSDIATEADWSFLEIEDVRQGLEGISRRVAEQMGGSGDDLYQDLVLFIAVRPHRWGSLRTGRVDGFLHWSRLKAQELVASATRHDWRLESLPEFDDEEDW